MVGCKVISIANQKGGIGYYYVSAHSGCVDKPLWGAYTTTVNLGARLANMQVKTVPVWIYRFPDIPLCLYAS